MPICMQLHRVSSRGDKQMECTICLVDIWELSTCECMLNMLVNQLLLIFRKGGLWHTLRGLNCQQANTATASLISLIPSTNK